MCIRLVHGWSLLNLFIFCCWALFYMLIVYKICCSMPFKSEDLLQQSTCRNNYVGCCVVHYRPTLPRAASVLGLAVNSCSTIGRHIVLIILFTNCHLAPEMHSDCNHCKIKKTWLYLVVLKRCTLPALLQLSCLSMFEEPSNLWCKACEEWLLQGQMPSHQLKSPEDTAAKTWQWIRMCLGPLHQMHPLVLVSPSQPKLAKLATQEYLEVVGVP